MASALYRICIPFETMYCRTTTWPSSYQLRHHNCHHLHFNGCFLGETVLAGHPVLTPPDPEKNFLSGSFFFWMPFQSSSHSTNSVKALKETRSTDHSQRITYCLHPFLIHCWTPALKAIAPFMMAIQHQYCHKETSVFKYM